jgi:hypothetical protein
MPSDIFIRTWRGSIFPTATPGPSEAELFWKGFLRSPADRGLRGVKLVVADDHKGLRAAASKVFHAGQQRSARSAIIPPAAYQL